MARLLPHRLDFKRRLPLAIRARNAAECPWKKGYRVDLPDNRAAPTIPPSGDSITTATSWPSGNRSLISRGLPDHSPTGRIDRTTFDSARVRPPFSPRPIFVVCSWSNPMSRTLPRPTPDPTLIATFSPALSTFTSVAACWPRFARSIAALTSSRCEPTKPTIPSTTISGV